ncbi:MAG: hypothetical protein ACI9TK_001336 [Flavobacteriaceae bacterium]|jgi:hypothetical protein
MEEIYSKVFSTETITYFFDILKTKVNDYYLTYY